MLLTNIRHLVFGFLFLFIVNQFVVYDLTQINLLANFLLLFIIGFTINQVGVFVIHPILNRTGFMKFDINSGYLERMEKKRRHFLIETNQAHLALIAVFFSMPVIIFYLWLTASHFQNGFEINVLKLMVSPVIPLILYKRFVRYIQNEIGKKDLPMKMV